MKPSSRPITILVCALGGEGGGVLSEWLYATALRCGHGAQSTSIPGVAQRTGATTYYIEVFPESDAALGGRQPVFCLNPVPGAIDLLVSSELLETVRQVGLGMASAERTTIVSSSARALTVAEKMQLGDGRLDDDTLLATLRQHGRQVEVLDLALLAREAGTVVSAVLLGVFHQVIDVWGKQKWAVPFVWIGANAITLYFAESIISFEKLAHRLVGGDVGKFFNQLLTPGAGHLLAAGVGLLLAIALAGFLHRRKIFLRV